LEAQVTILYDDCAKFKVENTLVKLYSDNTCYGKNTVAMFDVSPETIYLGDADPTIVAAIDAYEKLFSVVLTEDQIEKTMLTNLKGN
jgi:hypothetical protein